MKNMKKYLITPLGFTHWEIKAVNEEMAIREFLKIQKRDFKGTQEEWDEFLDNVARGTIGDIRIGKLWDVNALQVV